MKKMMILTLFVAFGIGCYADSICFYACAVSTRLSSGDWSKWEACRTNICFDDATITIYTRQRQQYFIYETDVLDLGKDDYSFHMAYYCTDKEGKKYCLRYRTYMDEDNYWQLQLYVQCTDTVVLYDITQW